MNSPSTDYSCLICQATYQDPRVLQCGHSFCASCLQQVDWPYSCSTCGKISSSLASCPPNLALQRRKLANSDSVLAKEDINVMFMMATKYDHQRVYQQLLDLGYRYQENRPGIPPLLLATDNNDIEMVKFLLPQFTDVDAADEDGETPLLSATKRHNGPIIKLLLARGADKYRENKYGSYPWDLADMYGIKRFFA